MASRKKKVKAAKAKDQQRLYFKDHPEELEELIAQEEEEKTAKAAGRPRRRKDSRGKKIPTEAERKKIAEKQSWRGEKEGKVAEDKQTASGQKANTWQRKAGKTTADANVHNSYRTYGKSGVNGTGHKERGFLATLVLYAKQHVGITAVVLCAMVAIIVAIYAAASASLQPNASVVQENEKAKSMIGITIPARDLLEDTGKFDGFFTDDKSGIPYAELFDDTITSYDAPVLESRGQEAIGDGTFAYNEEISSAVEAKAAQKSASASTASENASTADSE